MWECAYCGCQHAERPGRSCKKCGLIQAGKWTTQKYQILREYCYPLSLIMRNQGFEHCFLDVCAGSGVVQAQDSNKLIDGSPLIMAKTREVVENKIRDKSKEPSVKCVFIEQDAKIFQILEESTKSYQDFVTCINDDCNVALPRVLDEISEAFGFAYIDPFGVGEPVIRHETVKQVLERDFTELFIHFSWEGVSRMAGELKNIDHPDPMIRKAARSNVASLDLYLTDGWQEVEKRNLQPYYRKKEYLGLYEAVLKKHYPNIEYIEIPIGSKNPIYYLFFSTRNPTGHKIMKGILDKMRRRGSRSLEEFMR